MRLKFADREAAQEAPYQLCRPVGFRTSFTRYILPNTLAVTDRLQARSRLLVTNLANFLQPRLRITFGWRVKSEARLLSRSAQTFRH
jgi:hypothetical protein